MNRVQDQVANGSVPEARIPALWEGSQRRASRIRHRRKMWTTATVVLPLAVACLVAWSWVPGGRDASSEGFLTLVDGSPPVAVRAGADGDGIREVTFADGSRIRVWPGTSIEPVENSRLTYASHLTGGRVLFDIVPGGSRRWVVDAGDVAVEVLGTRFVVERTDESVRVEVERGQVRVTSPALGSERILDPGDSVTVDVEHAAPTPSEATRPLPPGPAGPREPNIEAPPASAPGPSRRTRTPTRDWRSLARQGAHTEAYRSLGPTGIAGTVTALRSAEELMLLADVARLSGNQREALGPLRVLLTTHRSDPRAPLAAVICGRIHTRLGEETPARQAFEEALELGLREPLATEVRRRLSRSEHGAPR